MVEEELEAAEDRLSATAGERHKMRRAQEPVAVHGSQELAIARREEYAAHRRALEARPAGLDLSPDFSP